MTETQAAAVALSGQAQEFFHGLWASLFYTPQAPPKSVLVCSPNADEGATTIACGLAISGASPAERSRAILVDFNLRRPGLHRRLDLADGVGASDVVIGASSLDEALQRVEPGPLDVLTAGSQRDRLLEILRTDRVQQLLGELQNRYDQVILDVAPVNQYPDAQILSELVAGAVLVAHCGRTSREALLAARQRLETGAGKVLGVVLNMRTYPIPGFLYRRV